MWEGTAYKPGLRRRHKKRGEEGNIKVKRSLKIIS